MPLYRLTASTEAVSFERIPFEDLERVLEDWIEKNPHMLLPGEGIAMIARQPRNPHGKFLDLLAIDESGACAIAELKKGQAPREVIAQALEYAAWVDSLTFDDLDQMAQEYQLKCGEAAGGLYDTYERVFNGQAGEQGAPASSLVTFNNRQRIVIVAEGFTPETEQTMRYLRVKFGVDITGLQFSVHRAGAETIVETGVVVGREPIAASQVTRARGRPGQLEPGHPGAWVWLDLKPPHGPGQVKFAFAGHVTEQRQTQGQDYKGKHFRELGMSTLAGDYQGGGTMETAGDNALRAGTADPGQP